MYEAWERCAAPLLLQTGTEAELFEIYKERGGREARRCVKISPFSCHAFCPTPSNKALLELKHVLDTCREVLSRSCFVAECDNGLHARQRTRCRAHQKVSADNAEILLHPDSRTSVESQNLLAVRCFGLNIMIFWSFARHEDLRTRNQKKKLESALWLLCPTLSHLPFILLNVIIIRKSTRLR